MREAIFAPHISSPVMTVVCFVSGSGTNYARIAAENPEHKYFVFTNRPGCGAAEIARKNGHRLIEFSHEPYLAAVREKYGAGNVPRNCPERIRYEQDISRLIEDIIGRKPDLICLAGYDQWTTDWLVERYYPRMLNVHPGDTTKDYVGLHWIPSAKAILAGDTGVRSTLMIVDKSEDKGPVLVQSKLLNIKDALAEAESRGEVGLLDDFKKVVDFARARGITGYDSFRKLAGADERRMMKRVCEVLLPALKVAGDWEIYPFAVRIIGEGRVEVEDRTIFLDGKPLPGHGYRMDQS